MKKPQMLAMLEANGVNLKKWNKQMAASMCAEGMLFGRVQTCDVCGGKVSRFGPCFFLDSHPLFCLRRALPRDT
jgi:hypothetical protein